MAIVSVGYLQGWEADQTQDQDNKHRRSYLVISSIWNDSLTDILTAVDPTTGVAIPAMFSSFGPDDPGAIVTSRSPRQDVDAPNKWIVDVTWSRLTFYAGGGGKAQTTKGNQSHDPAQRKENPLDRPPVVRVGCERYQWSPRHAFDGTAIKNKAGQRMTIEADDFRPTITVSRNEAQFNLNTLEYVNTINSAPFLGYAQARVKLNEITAESGFENNQLFDNVTYVFQVANNGYGWQPRVLNAGYYQLVGGKLVEITLEGGRTPSEPLPLDNAGAALVNPTEADLVWLTFNVYDTRDFNDLGIF